MADHADMDAHPDGANPHVPRYTFDDFVDEEEKYQQYPMEQTPDETTHEPESYYSD